jgi:2-oxoisovalerate dehydrogenase E2 component (dihydrolipoyl transacylase)
MDFQVPELGEGVYEAELVAWKVKPGDKVQRGQILMEVLTDKATMEVPAAFSGVIQSLDVEAGEQIKVGQKVLSYDGKEKPDGEKSPAPEEQAKVSDKHAKKDDEPLSRPAPAKVPAKTTASPAHNGPAEVGVKAAPSVRQMARQLGVDLSHVRGSGPQGRILIEDLSRLIQDRSESAEAEMPAKVHATPKPPMDLGKPGTIIKLQGVRRKIAEHMVLAKKSIPHYSYVDECDVSELVRLREGLRETFQSKGLKLTYVPFVIKAVVAALKEVPLVNASLNEDVGEIVLHDRYHIGIAVAAPAGLMVPVVRDADKKSLLDVAQEVERLSNDARGGKSKLEDLRGGTFTVTSIGNIGGLFATPIVNHPEVGILGVGKIVKRPVFDDHGQIQAADMVYLSFSFDHRVLDGAVGAVFGNAVIKRLQNPAALLVD